MEETGLGKVPAPDFTATLSRGRARVLILDPKAIPIKYLRPREPEPDKGAIGDALRDGKQIDGAELTNSGMTLTVRVS